MRAFQSRLLAATRTSQLLLPTPYAPRCPIEFNIRNIFPKSTLSQFRNMSSAMGKRLDGKTILVTGASSGIGRSVAQEFARTSPKNLKLILTARRVDTLKKVAADINKEVGDGVKVLPVKLDVSKPEDVFSFIDKLPAEFKEIDILINNAGLVKGVAKAPEIATEDINIMFATNVTGLINMTQEVMKIMKKRPDGGAGDIINIGSIAGREGYPGGSIYCATKAAVRTFTDSLRRELIATRIRVMEVDPGQVETVSFIPRRWWSFRLTYCRSSLSSDLVATRQKLMRSTLAASR